MPPTSCRACGLDMKTLPGGILTCPRCDTTAQAGGQRVGPPNSPGTRDGWFLAPFGDTK